MIPPGLLRKKIHLLLFSLFVLVYAFKLQDVQVEYNRSKYVIHEDAFGYYLILPALFIHQDPSFSFLDSMRKSAYIPPVVNPTENGKKVCKYYSGVALLQLPFFLTALLTAPDSPTLSGFETEFHFFMLIASAFYLLCGMYLLLMNLLKIGLPSLAAGLAPFAVLFGTNLYAYATYDPAYSHVYSFFALMLFIRMLLNYRENENLRAALSCGLVFGLIMLIRPLNGVSLLFIPVILNKNVLFRLFSVKFRNILFFGSSAVLMVSVQSILWYIQTGKFYVYPYGGEKLNLMDPKIPELIFSFDCGWAIYTPLPFLVLCVSLLLLTFRKEYRKALFAGTASLSVLYLLSCWYYLHYGCTVGCRPITEFYGPLALLAGAAFKPYLKKKISAIFLTLILSVFIAHNMIVQKQFFDHIINWCDMDRERYQMVFLKTHEAYKYSTSKLWDYQPFLSSEPFLTIPADTSISIGKDQKRDLFEFELPPLENRDSLLAFTIGFRANITGSGKEAYLRILATDGGNYREQLRHLLKRELKQGASEKEFDYTFHLNGSLSKGRISVFLESVDSRSEAEVLVKELRIRRFRFPEQN